jgi:predicted amidohydrolase YtcJ
VSETGYLVPPWDALEAMRPGDGPEDLRVGPLKVFSDGANQCALCIRPLQLLTAFASTIAHMISRRTLAPLRLARQTKFRYERGRLRAGIRFFTPSQLRELAQRATERGVDLAVHANGNDAVGIVTDALAGVSGSHRIEHCTFMTLDQCARIADANLTAVVQPMFLQLPSFDDVPPIPGVTAIPIRSLLDAGVRVAGSSDAPVTSCDVLAAMRAAMRRKTLRGYAIGPDQAVSAEDVLAMYTREAARACGCLDVTGTLESSKRADLVVLSADPCARGVELEAVRVERTILAGKTVFVA